VINSGSGSGISRLRRKIPRDFLLNLHARSARGMLLNLNGRAASI
jgi:hypothetical protein